MTSKAEAFARELESLGWKVERLREPNVNSRRVRARRGVEQIELTWWRGEDGIDRLDGGGIHKLGSVTARPLNRAELLRRAALPAAELLRTEDGSTYWRRVPFAITDADDVILKHVAGREIRWLNTMTGKVERDSVLRSSPHTKVEFGTAGRVLCFAGRLGFRSVRLAYILEVR